MPLILVIQDDPQMQKVVTLVLQRAGFQVATYPDVESAVERLSDEEVHVVIGDAATPTAAHHLLVTLNGRGNRAPVIMALAGATVSSAVELMREGVTDILTKPFSGDDLVRAVSRLVEGGSTSGVISRRQSPPNRAIITRDPLMIRTLEIAGAVARSDATVLIQGESGTGKELMARLIHDSSPRQHEPFVAVNCAALPSSLLESELFGHEKGAFTGAHARKIGKFELAHRGTILLDEVSEMEVLLQAKLLRVLQEREVDRVGGREPVGVDVRVVATTNRNLAEMVRSGGFRADLYYRLNVIPLTLPSLRQRPGDIALLAEYFMRQILGKQAPPLTQDVIAMLQQASWPGNIRELRNAVERAAILAQGNVPRQEDFLMEIHDIESHELMRLTQVSGEVSVGDSEVHTIVDLARPLAPRSSESISFDSREKISPVSDGQSINREDPSLVIRSGMTVHEVEKTLILETLRSTRNNRTQAATLLGISVRTLRNKLAEYRLPDEEDHGEAPDMLHAEASSG
jgi:two-component system response regulator FlrC